MLYGTEGGVIPSPADEGIFGHGAVSDRRSRRAQTGATDELTPRLDALSGTVQNGQDGEHAAGQGEAAPDPPARL